MSADNLESSCLPVCFVVRFVCLHNYSSVKLFSPFRKNLMPKTSMLLPRDLIIPALHHATAINNVRSQNLRHTARIYAISIAKRVTENGMNSNTLYLKNHRNFIFALQIYLVVL